MSVTRNRIRIKKDESDGSVADLGVAQTKVHQTVKVSKKSKKKKNENMIIDLYEARLATNEIEMGKMSKQLDIFEAYNTSSFTEHQKQSLWSSVFQKSVQKKSDLVKLVNQAKSSFIHCGIIDLLVGDSIAPSPITDNVLDLTSENKDIKKGLEDFQQKVNIDAIVTDIIEDVISFGEYYLTVEGKEGEGITKVSDNVDQGQTVAVYDGFKPSKFLQMSEDGRKKVVNVDIKDMVHFCIGSRKLRIKVENTTQGSKKLTEYVRIGRPLFYGVFDLVNTLTLLTALVPASYLQKINGTSIIGVSVPDGLEAKKAFKICRQYENLLNKVSSYDPTQGDMTVNDLISQAGKFKCVPLYGDKGRMDKVDPRYEELTDISMFVELKRDIFGTVGVPYNFFYGGDTSKGDSLKQFARYVRNLYMIQSAVASGIKQMATIHLNYLGHKPAPSHIQAKFANALISVESLDKLEFEGLLSNTLNEVVEAVMTIGSRTRSVIDTKVLNEFLSKYMKMLSLEGVFKSTGKDIEPPAEEEI